MAAPPLDSPCDGPVTYPRDNKARFGGQRFGKLKVATLNVRGIAEKTEELQTTAEKENWYYCILRYTGLGPRQKRIVDVTSGRSQGSFSVRAYT